MTIRINNSQEKRNVYSSTETRNCRPVPTNILAANFSFWMIDSINKGTLTAINRKNKRSTLKREKGSFYCFSFCTRFYDNFVAFWNQLKLISQQFTSLLNNSNTKNRTIINNSTFCTGKIVRPNDINAIYQKICFTSCEVTKSHKIFLNHQCRLYLTITL